MDVNAFLSGATVPRVNFASDTGVGLASVAPPNCSCRGRREFWRVESRRRPVRCLSLLRSWRFSSVPIPGAESDMGWVRRSQRRSQTGARKGDWVNGGITLTPDSHLRMSVAL